MPDPIKPGRSGGRAKTMTAIAAVPLETPATAVVPVDAPVVAPAPAVVEAAQDVTETVSAATETAADTVTETLTRGPDTMATTAESIADRTSAFTAAAATDTADKFQSMFGDVQGRAKAAMDKGARFYEELGELTKGNVEAMLASGRVASSAAETFGQDAAAYGKQSFETAMATFRSLASAKSPTELFQLQSDYARSAFDAMVAEGSRTTEKLVKIAGDVVQPLSSRFAVAAEKVKTAAL